MSTNRLTDKYIAVYSHSGMLHKNDNEPSTTRHKNVDEPHKRNVQ